MNESRPPSWKWCVCGLLLLATMLNYMDRQTLAQVAKTICTEYDLTNRQYGNLEMGFGLAFATGALFFGFLVDRVSARWLYPLVLIGWSIAGIATAYAVDIGKWMLTWIHSSDAASAALDVAHWESRAAYLGFLGCRTVLGFFEAGHWPCALVTTQTILNRQDRSFGNSILQSGAAIGAIITPWIVLAFLSETIPGSWRWPFVTIGCLGAFWVIPWLTMVRGRDLVRTGEPRPSAVALPADTPPGSIWRPFLALVVGVLMINITWQYFRAWLPKFLQEEHGYSLAEVGVFTSAYYFAADLGCITVGVVVKWLAGVGWRVHTARLTTFAICAALTTLSVLVAVLPRGPLLLALLLIIGAGALGLFPNYYSFTQELSKTHQGKITGILGAIAWVGSAILQPLAGESIDETKSYATGIIVAGLAPLLAAAAVWLLWEQPARPSQAKPTHG
jgi:MFS transporter, ACS family, hexuronate transporter